MKTKIVLLFAALFCGGCVPVQVDLRDTRARQSVLSRMEPVPGVRLAPRLLVLEVMAQTPPARTRYSIGPLLESVFSGGEDAPVSIDLVSADFGQFAAPTLASKVHATFTLEVVLRRAGGENRIRVVGEGFTAYDYDNAAREAVDNSILKLAAAIRAALQT